jgi:hypothetical protein
MQAKCRKSGGAQPKAPRSQRCAFHPAQAVPDNKIERIQHVLRHFLGEIEGADLGKS